MRFFAVCFGFDLREGKGYSPGVAVRGQSVDPGATRIAEAKQFGYLVEGFAGGVVYSVTHIAVVPGFSVAPGEVEMCVAARDDQRQCRQGKRILGQLSLLQQDSVDVAFEVVDGDERLAQGVGEGFGVGDAYEQSAGQSGAFGYCDGVEVLEGDACLGDSSTDDGDDIAQVFAGGQFRDDSAVGCVRGNLRGDYVGQGLGPAADNGGCGFVAGAFYTQYETCAHLSMIFAAWDRRQSDDEESGTIRSGGHCRAVAR